MSRRADAGWTPPAADDPRVKVGAAFRELYARLGHPKGLNPAYRWRVEQGRAGIETMVKVAEAYGATIDIRVVER